MSKIEYPFVYMSIFFLQVTAIFISFNARWSVTIAVPNTIFWSVIYGIGLLCGWFYRRNSSVVIKIISYGLLIIAVPTALLVSSGSTWQFMFVILLVFVQAARNFTLSSQRDLNFAYIISLVLVVNAASVNTNMTLVFSIIAYVLAGMYALLAAYMDSVLAGAQGGDRALLLQKVKLPIKGGGLTVLTVFLACLIYVILPRFPSPQIGMFPDTQGWQRPGFKAQKEKPVDDKLGEGRQRETESGHQTWGGGQGGKAGEKEGEVYSGFREQFDIFTNKPRSREVVFHLQTKYPTYARGKVFDTFDGRYWTRQEQEDQALYSRIGEFRIGEYRPSGAKQVYHIKKDIPGVVFTAYKPTALWFPAITLEVNQDRGIMSPGPLWKGTIYSVESEIQETGGDLGGRLSGGKEKLRSSKRYVKVPVNLFKQVRELAGSITQSNKTKYDKAVAIEEYLRSHYRYVDTMEQKDGKNRDNRMLTFLFQDKKGTAEYFATAMALLLRSVEIPSRVVTGYRVTRYDPLLSRYEAQQRDAHVWVEAYFDAYGWTTFEPTPKYSNKPNRNAYFILPFTMSYLNKKLESTIEKKQKQWWAQWLKVFMDTIKKIKEFMMTVWSEMTLFFRFVWNWFIGTGWIFFLSAATVTAAAIFFQTFILLYFKRWMLSRLRTKDPLRFIHECYREIERIFTLNGVPRKSHVSVEEHRMMIVRKFSHLMPDIDAVIFAFNSVRYGGVNVDADDSEKVYRAYVSILKGLDR